MGQKVNPIGLRIGINKTWKSKWYVQDREYVEVLHEDFRLRKVLKEIFEGIKNSDISDIEIIRYPQKIIFVIHTSRPGVIIGNKGESIDMITSKLQKQTNKKIQLKIKEVKKPDINAQAIANNIARQLTERRHFRRAMKLAVMNARKAGGMQGLKIKISGRLGGADMARVEDIKFGRVPLHTLRANIDYGFAEAHTTFGVIGVKVWVCLGEILRKPKKDDAGSIVAKKPARVNTGITNVKKERIIKKDKIVDNKTIIESSSNDNVNYDDYNNHNDKEE